MTAQLRERDTRITQLKRELQLSSDDSTAGSMEPRTHGNIYGSNDDIEFFPQIQAGGSPSHRNTRRRGSNGTSDLLFGGGSGGAGEDAEETSEGGLGASELTKQNEQLLRKVSMSIVTVRGPDSMDMNRPRI